MKRCLLVKWWLVVAMMWLVLGSVFAQNLVQNKGFEACGESPDQAADWFENIDEAALVITCDDPDQSEIVLPVSMTVACNGYPDIVVTPAALTNLRVAAGGVLTEQLLISNTGDEPLDYSIHPSDTVPPPLSRYELMRTGSMGVDDRYTYDFAVADVDMDGDTDVYELRCVIVPRYMAPPSYEVGIVWWENQGGAVTNYLCHTIQFDLSSAKNICSGDMDGDGDVDVLVACASSSNEIYWLENEVSASTNAREWMVHSIASAPGVVKTLKCADVDGDGDLDVVGSMPAADRVAVWVNAAGDGSVWVRHDVDLASGGVEAIEVADMDGDGSMDIVGVAKTMGQLVWWNKASGTGTTWVRHVAVSNCLPESSLALGDMDKDGDIDLLASPAATNALSWWENGAEWVEHRIDDGAYVGSGTAYPSHDINVCDMDGDGDADVAASAGALIWWEQTESNWVKRSVCAYIPGGFFVRCVDFNGDGLPDVLGALPFAKQVRVWINDGLAGSTSWLGIRPESGTVAPGESAVVTLVIDAVGLSSGSRRSEAIQIRSNDPNKPTVMVPIHVLVTPSIPLVQQEPSYTEGSSNAVFWKIVAGTTAYICECSTRTQSPDSLIESTTKTKIVFSGLEEGTRYYYRVKAVADMDGEFYESDWSPWVNSRQIRAEGDDDGDGMNNRWEMANGLDPLVDDQHGDLDGDGQSNISEFHSGTRANDPESALRICSMRSEGLNSFIVLQGGSNVTQYVLHSDRLVNPSWTCIYTNATPATELSEVVLIDGPQSGYYRVKVIHATE